MNRLNQTFYEQATVSVARQLLGKLLVRAEGGIRISGIVVEVEAYLSSDDAASHSHRGPKPRNQTMFARSGHLYVYSIHAKYCLNIVTEAAGSGAAVLIRALEPWEGTRIMAQRRSNGSPRQWTTGPARLCQALDVDRSLDGVDLCSSDQIWLERSPRITTQIPWKITTSPRIGISSAADLPLRFFIDGNRFVSGLARLHQQPRTWAFQDHVS